MNNKIIPATTLVVSILIISGCASLSKDECLQADWRLIGYEDGAKGREASYLGEHRQACAEYGVIPDREYYLAGRDDGLIEYCQPYNGYQQGLNGNTYQGVCPNTLSNAFLRGYHYGSKIHGLETRLDRKENELTDAEDELKDLEAKQKAIETQLLAPGTPTEQRAKLLTETKSLSRQQGEAKQSLRQFEREIARLTLKIKQLKARSPF